MKVHTQGIIVTAFSLVIGDEGLAQWRTKYNITPAESSDDELRAKILKGLILELLTESFTNNIFRRTRNEPERNHRL